MVQVCGFRVRHVRMWDLPCANLSHGPIIYAARCCSPELADGGKISTSSDAVFAVAPA